ncbi:uncharacterized protein F4817DRAFT_88929 [Daldinia loculata]|uniref:uncharacterized protein n=1 Tax=Daldinia loculata TaxID=103429 RepID=UPI0020C1F0A0|nr:uncharacterized protein F4817DRAFT_88929 [Daldinia loculata]KAI1647997.1 hypothetical protein F4817DRAFT_88929 [Daldinia loculata]
MSKPFVSGVAFGAALTAAAIHLPDVIVEQMTFQNWHMVVTFLTASGTSTLLVNTLQRLGCLRLNPRDYSTLGIFGALDGNIIGGLILGAGLSVSGSCPGTVFAQVGAGIRSGLYTLGGGILGGIIWSGFLRPALRNRAKSSTESSDGKSYHRLTLDKWTGTSHLSALVAVETLFASAVATIVYLASPESGGLVGPVTGGILIAGAQTVSIVTRKSLLGTSSSFEEVGDYFWWAVGQRDRPKSHSAIALTTGMIIGALAVSLASPTTHVTPDTTIEPIRAILGGVLLAVGSRMAGGCTSGHGISGISLLSISSFVTVAAMFAGGAGVAAIIG